MTDERSLETLTAAEFRASHGARFRLTGSPAEDGVPASFEAELADVTEYPAGAAGTFRAPFSVVFHGPLEPVMPQGIYRVEHEQFGALELFIVPLGPNVPRDRGAAPAVMRYEAVFG
jgi:uncharacterized protein DUF6916